MKTVIARSVFFPLLILALACKREDVAPVRAPESRPAANSRPTSEPGQPDQSLTVMDTSEKAVLTVTTSGSSVTIEYADTSGTHRMTGSSRDSGKRKYESPSGAVASEGDCRSTHQRSARHQLALM